MKIELLCLALVGCLAFGALAGCTLVTPPPPTATPPPALPNQIEIPDVVEEGGVPLVGQWRYQVVPEFTPEVAAPEFDDSGWVTVQAPAPWPDQGMGDRVGAGDVVVYRRQVDVPAEWAGQPIGISAWASILFPPRSSSRGSACRTGAHAVCALRGHHGAGHARQPGQRSPW